MKLVHDLLVTNFAEMFHQDRKIFTETHMEDEVDGLPFYHSDMQGLKPLLAFSVDRGLASYYGNNSHEYCDLLNKAASPRIYPIRMTISTITRFIDSKYQSWFLFDDFNQIQQQCLSSILHSDENIVISAPTGSGKTSLFELAMIRAFQNTHKQTKILYLAPMRALCTEKTALWTDKLERMGKRCVELIGGSDQSGIIKDYDIEDADLIISTPEKWDFVTRTSETFLSVNLVLIDEVHTLNDKRGAVLESIIARMRLVHSKQSTPIRILAVSATIPNISNISQWLNAKSLQFPDSMRPVPLKTHVLAVPMNGKNGFAFDYSLNYKLPEVIRKYSNKQPTLIFCSTRKSAIKNVDFLDINNTSTRENQLTSHICLEDKKLEGLIVQKGLAYHHAGLSQTDREAVESLFRSGQISVLCSTSTLAIGVNLPAHLVIIKSTLQYTSESGYSEYNDLDVRQMIGRAGRAGYDTEGISVIITSTTSEHLYRTISEGKLEIDSKLIDGFIEHFNTEITNRFIKSISDATDWFKFTFLYVRMKINPSKYSLSPKESIEPQIKSNLMFYLNELVNCGVIRVNNENGISCTSLGNSMAKHFIKLKGLKDLQSGNFLKLTETSDLLKLLSKNSESQANFKSGDKVLLSKIARHPQLIIPVGGKVDWEGWKKPFLLVQVALQMELSEFDAKLTPSQRSDQQSYLDHFCRLLKFIVDVSALNDRAVLLRNSLELLSSLKGRSWHSNAKLFQQLQGIGQVHAKSLFNAGIRSIAELRETEASRIEVLLKRNPPFGRNLKRSIDEQFPNTDFDCNLQREEGNLGRLNISINTKSQTSTPNMHVHLLVISYKSQSTGRILLYNQISLTNCPIARSLEVDTGECSFSCSLMYEDYSGLNKNICFEITRDYSIDRTDIIKDTGNTSGFDNRELIDNLVTETESIDEFDISLSDLDSITNVASTQLHNSQRQKYQVPIPTVMLASPVSISTTPPSCKHTCKDKLSCAHLCCKAGHLKRPSTSQPASDKQIPKKPTTFLAGVKRSLTNAREYLRKYQPVNVRNVSVSSLIPTTTTTKNADLYNEIELALRSIE